jgi:hypothetical protein
MSILYGAALFRADTNVQNFSYDAIGKNSEVFAYGDPVTVQSGLLSVTTGLQTIVGISVKTQTMASNNSSVAKVTPGYLPIGVNDLYLMGTNSDMTGNATDAGTYYGLSTGGTGIVQVDKTTGATTGSSRVVEIVQVDPFNLGGTGSGSGIRQVVVRFIKTPYTNVTITA